MRLRNIPGADNAISNSPLCIDLVPNNRGNWQSFFDKEQPIHMEIGMGKGQFITTLATNNPDINYIGVEMYSSVLLRAIQKMELLDEPPKNLRFICNDARLLSDAMAPGEISKIYLNFSDPWPKERHSKRRLTSHQFLASFDKVLSPNGTIEFKTDNLGLFEFALEEVPIAHWHLDQFTRDLHHDPTMNQGNIMTEYEEKFSSLGNPIYKYIISRNHK